VLARLTLSSTALVGMGASHEMQVTFVTSLVVIGTARRSGLIINLPLLLSFHYHFMVQALSIDWPECTLIVTLLFQPIQILSVVDFGLLPVRKRFIPKRSVYNNPLSVQYGRNDTETAFGHDKHVCRHHVFPSSENGRVEFPVNRIPLVGERLF
jgi:hypothetical protein